MLRKSSGEPTEPLDEETRQALLSEDEHGVTLFDRNKCEHCGGNHLRSCPKLRQLEFYESGKIKNVEFWPWGEFPEDDIIWPEALFEDEGE